MRTLQNTALLLLLLPLPPLVVPAHVFCAHERVLVADGKVRSFKPRNAVDGRLLKTERGRQHVLRNSIDRIRRLGVLRVEHVLRDGFGRWHLVFAREIQNMIFVRLAELDIFRAVVLDAGERQHDLIQAVYREEVV